MIDPDAALVAEVQQGNGASLSLLYQRHVGLVFGYIRRRVDCREVAEDLTSETFLACVERIRSFRGDASFKNWLLTIARRRVAEHWRKAYQLPEVSLDLVLAFLGTPPQQEEGHTMPDPPRYDVHEILAKLPERSRRVLECRLLEGKSVRETAQELLLSEANVKVMQHRALKEAASHAPSAKGADAGFRPTEQ